MNTTERRPRLSFARAATSCIEVPSLHSTQLDSFAEFLHLGIAPENRPNTGLQHAFTSVFPVTSSSGIYRLEFVSYELKNPEFSLAECRQRGITYSAPLWANFRMVTSADKASAKVFGNRIGPDCVAQVTEESVYLADMPMMTPTGSFLINGTERVIISQIHRSPGAFFTRTTERTPLGDVSTYAARISPSRGSWIEFVFDFRNRMWFRIDKKRRLPATTLLYALGLSTEDILATYFDHDVFGIHSQDVIYLKSPPRYGDVFPENITSRSGEVLVPAGRIVSHNAAKNKLSDMDFFTLPDSYFYDRILATDLVSKEGKVVAKANDTITDSLLRKIFKSGITEFKTLRVNDKDTGAWLSDTLRLDKFSSKKAARAEIFSIMRPKDTRDESLIDQYFEDIFESEVYYELSEVGRYKFNSRVYRAHPDSVSRPEWVKKLIPARVPKGYTHKQTLTKLDIMSVIGLLIEMRNGRIPSDDVDSLDTRRVRPVGELLESQVRLGLARAVHSVRDKLNKPQPSILFPSALMTSRSVLQTVREFFASSQLSQFMDQTNPLSELTHKRRVSALGPGGLTKDTTSFEVRDVHSSHYGRLCPIETPEGPNIGLINSLALYARTNKYGFLETPYRRVVGCCATQEIDYLTADAEAGAYIAQASSLMDEKGNLLEDRIQCRHNGEFVVVDKSKVTYIDVAFEQVVSVAAATIPFLEHDDANRSLMGSNMLRQAVPCLIPEKPLVGTGLERVITRDSGNTVLSKSDGVVEYVDAKRIVVRNKQSVATYSLTKRSRSNQSTDLNQRPIVNKGDYVSKGDVLADGSASDLGEMALGQNMVVAFMPWNGFNFEDSILISEKIVEQDRFTSVHIEELVVQVRDTNLGPEELTRDIPTLGEHQLSHLDYSGVVSIGSKVKPGDVIVGKVTPKGETGLGPEEKLLRAIFGSKVDEVRESCLRVPAGMEGTVIDVQIFTRGESERDPHAQAIVDERIRESREQLEETKKILERELFDRLQSYLTGMVVPEPYTNRKVILNSEYLTNLCEKQGRRSLLNLSFSSPKVMATLKQFKAELARIEDTIERSARKKEKSLSRGDDLPSGVLRVVKVYVAVKRVLQAGDKMAGRHGNKGVVSRVVPVEDMPRLKDGTSVDVVLNPLGVPSRMNLGQILEVHIGWAALGIGQRISDLLDSPESAASIAGSLRELYSEIYAIAGATNPFLDMQDADVLKVSGNYRKGLTLASPVFDGATEEQIRGLLKIAYPEEVAQLKGLTDSRLQANLYDGQTGDQFERPVTVGVMNMLKLHHLVEDKMHARSTGPYSLVTQQPLGGKSQMGGQRVGEMEVWALEAYGAAHILQEMLTVKSDDVRGREATYQNLLEGNQTHVVGIPESFNVLVQEIRALGMDISLENSSKSDCTN